MIQHKHDCVIAQNNLGNAYWNLSEIEEREANLRQAITDVEGDDSAD